jgi:hypothetical protein
VEIDIGFASFLWLCLASKRSPVLLVCSVAQLEELRAECDKELNNAIMMGDSALLPFPLRSLCVMRFGSGMEALAKGGVVQSGL